MTFDFGVSNSRYNTYLIVRLWFIWMNKTRILMRYEYQLILVVPNISDREGYYYDVFITKKIKIKEILIRKKTKEILYIIYMTFITQLIKILLPNSLYIGYILCVYKI